LNAALQGRARFFAAASDFDDNLCAALMFRPVDDEPPQKTSLFVKARAFQFAKSPARPGAILSYISALVRTTMHDFAVFDS